MDNKTQNIRELIARIRGALEEERAIQERVDYLAAKAASTGAICFDKVGSKSNRTGSGIEAASIRLAEAIEELHSLNRKNYLLKLEASKRFWEIDDKAAAYILCIHYAQGLSLREVADSIGMSKEFVTKKCREGIRAVSMNEFKKLGDCTQNAPQL